MLGYLTRMAPVVLTPWLWREPSLVSRRHYRVSLRQIDPNLHMNQAAYAEVFEWGRADWVVRSGAWSAWRTKSVWPVVAEQRIVYRRELKPWARYCVDTRAVDIDGRLLSVLGHILVGDQIHTRCEAKLIFIGPDGVLEPEALPELCGWLQTNPLPVEDWRHLG